MPYYLCLNQEYSINIQIRRQPEEEFGGSLNLVKRRSFDKPELLPAYILPNAGFSGQYTPTEAREVAEWWQVAAQAAETLDALIKTREDLKRPIAVRMVGAVVEIAFVEGNDDTI